MGGVGEHVNGLYGDYFVAGVEQGKVAGLGGGVAADIDDALGVGIEYDLYDVGVHAGTGRVGDDDIGMTVLTDEVVGEDVFHVAGIEQGVGDAVEL